MPLRALPLLVLLSVTTITAAEPVKLGRSLGVFLDDHLVQSMQGNVARVVHEPHPEEVVLVTDQPWEGNTCAYYTIFQDGDRYRMYYRGSHADEQSKKSQHPEVTCYAESTDGIHWIKPELGICDWNGSSANNIVWDGVGTHNFTPFMDASPAAPPESRYKAIASGKGVGKGLYVFHSADGLHWSLMHDTPVITKGAFDSQNLAFWDPVSRKYVDYHRTFVNGVRAIMTCSSNDFVNWTDPVLLTYPEGTPEEHLYTNAIRLYPQRRQIYPKAPRLFLGFPTRYQPRTSQVEPILMSSRDGSHFERFDKAVIPITAPSERDGNRSNYMANGLVTLPGKDREWSVYASESYYDGPDSRLRRFSYRLDGLVSLRADEAGGEVVTRPFRFEGDQLILNYSTRKGGSIRVELQTAEGAVIAPFDLESCDPLEGDDVAHVVGWKLGDGLIRHSDKPVKLRFILRDADLYSMHFRLLE